MFRSWGSLVCILTAVFALGGRAYAGATGTPFSSTVCPTIDATANMGNPSTTGFQNAATVKECIKLCDRAASLCRSFSKRSTSCDVAWAGTVLSYNKSNCVIVTSNATDRRACIQSANANREALVAGFKASLASAVANCDVWKATCETSCGP
jgi:hypothetical protein